MDLPLDERTWQLLQREARRQGTTVSQLAAHSVLVYLAELDRLTPPQHRNGLEPRISEPLVAPSRLSACARACLGTARA